MTVTLVPCCPFSFLRPISHLRLVQEKGTGGYFGEKVFL